MIQYGFLNLRCKLYQFSPRQSGIGICMCIQTCHFSICIKSIHGGLKINIVIATYVVSGRNLCYTIKSNSYKRLSKAIGNCVVLITLINKLISVDYNIFV